MLRRHLLGRFIQRRSNRRSRRRMIRLESLESRDVPAVVGLDSLVVDPTTYDNSTILVRMNHGPFDPNSLIPGSIAARPLGILTDVWEVTLAAGTSAANAIHAARASTGVREAFFNYQLQITQTPNDPRYDDQWGWNNTGQTGGTVDADIDAPEAWNVFTGS